MIEAYLGIGIFFAVIMALTHIFLLDEIRKENSRVAEEFTDRDAFMSVFAMILMWPFVFWVVYKYVKGER